MAVNNLRSTPLCIMATLLVSALCGGLIMLSISNHYAYQQLRAQQLRLSNQVGNLGSSPLYGIIQSIDASTRSFTVKVENRALPGGPSIVFTLKTNDATAFVAQALAGNGSVYTNIATDASRSFSDLKPGDRIAFMMLLNDAAAPTATAVLFGNPL